MPCRPRLVLQVGIATRLAPGDALALALATVMAEDGPLVVVLSPVLGKGVRIGLAGVVLHSLNERGARRLLAAGSSASRRSPPALRWTEMLRGRDGLKRLERLWAGDLPLREAFWTWAVGGGLAVNVVTSLLFLALVTVDRLILALFVGYVCSVPYNIVALIGVWRAADRYDGNPALADAARMVTAIGMAFLSLT